MNVNYEISSDVSNRFMINFRDGPENLIGLRMAPDQLERRLSLGSWLILVFAIWDSRDRPTIDIASRIASIQNKVSVGVRPFESTDEFGSWMPQFNWAVDSLIATNQTKDRRSIRITTSIDDHPMWLKLLDGELVSVLVGKREFDEVLQFALEP